MGDHFVLLVDRLLTESTLEAAIESRNLLKQLAMPANDAMTTCSSEAISSPRKLAECRICQDEDFDSNMETPCSCCGSLKYAHRRCVQKWCNEKGDTVCEICHQQFRPDYTAPPPIFRLGGIPVNLRGNWGIVRRDLNNPRLISMLSTDRNYIDHEYAVSTSRSVICCRTIIMIFMVLLVWRHSLPVIVNRAGHYSFSFLMLSLLRISWIILPIFMIVKAVSARLHHRQQQASLSISPPDEETGSLIEPNQSGLVNVQSSGPVLVQV
ncbi:ubiquitin-protein ligase [Lithospermum erythrorhizon]|uniref:Ubiquitin-protein ligase n=1 Tax=Lithospermum erythrorhizon TaxID=34254 RepID=A0AAV3QX95_LITER